MVIIDRSTAPKKGGRPPVPIYRLWGNRDWPHLGGTLVTRPPVTGGGKRGLQTSNLPQMCLLQTPGLGGSHGCAVVNLLQLNYRNGKLKRAGIGIILQRLGMVAGTILPAGPRGGWAVA